MSNETSSNAPDLHVIVFAGPNGSGKSTLIDEIKETGLATLRGVYPVPAYVINPDQVAKDLQGEFANQSARDEAAQRAAMQIRAEAIANKQPFAFETVMSHPSGISELLMLKRQDYRLFLTFITTDDPEKNMERVKLRYETGTTTSDLYQVDCKHGSAGKNSNYEVHTAAQLQQSTHFAIPMKICWLVYMHLAILMHPFHAADGIDEQQMC